MAKATFHLSKKTDRNGERPILMRLDITRTNRPQFKTGVSIAPEHFVDGAIKVPARSRHNRELRESILRKKTELDTFLASINAIAQSLPVEALTRKRIMEMYEAVRTLSPSEINRTTIAARKSEETRKKAELVRQLLEEDRPGVIEYMRSRIEGMEKGTIKRKGNRYKAGTIHAYKRGTAVLERFSRERPFGWNDINERLLDEYVLFQEGLGYMKKTINKNLSTFSALLNAALKEGHRFNPSVLSHFPKLQIVHGDMVEEIYLTGEELEALYAMELEGEDSDVRDVFLVGCYTSQRFSDYSRIRKSDISFHDGIGIITLTQRKTDTEVSIPILNDNLIRILERHGYELPRVENVALNKRIKEILKRLSDSVPSLAEDVPTRLRLDQRRKEARGEVTFRRDKNGEALIPRYDLVTTHTARRTGITLMYLSRLLDSHEMMSISGHKTESVFHDYIKLSGIELATGIARKVAKARSEAEVKGTLLARLAELPAEQLAGLLEMVGK